MFFFVKYFIRYLIQAKTRQGLMILVILGLLLCSFALIVLQGVMTGLQTSMMKKYQSVEGSYQVISINNDLEGSEHLMQLHAELESQKIVSYPGLMIEVLIKQGEYMAPSLMTAYDFSKPLPAFLKNYDKRGIIVGADLASKLKSGPQTLLTIYSPADTISMLGDIPKFARDSLSDFVLTGLEDVDSVRSWIRLSLLQNLVREVKINSLVFFTNHNFAQVQKIISKYSKTLKIITWEEQHSELMWAFKLESIVMVLLFTMMAVLVSLTIISSCSLFLAKIQWELFVFWLLGKSVNELKKSLWLVLQLLIAGALTTGIIMGWGVLLYLQLKTPQIMPDVFLERTLPVKILWSHVLIAWLLPYSVASFFTYWSLREFFKGQVSLSQLLRRVE